MKNFQGCVKNFLPALRDPYRPSKLSDFISIRFAAEQNGRNVSTVNSKTSRTSATIEAKIHHGELREVAIKHFLNTIYRSSNTSSDFWLLFQLLPSIQRKLQVMLTSRSIG
jgi:hypothetical protein